MKINIISKFVKLLIGILILASLWIMVYLLPILANQVTSDWIEITYLKMPLLIIAQLSMFLFIAGLALILYLIYLFDSGNTFTKHFSKGINWLAAMCLFAIGFLMIVFFTLSSVGGPGPGGVYLIILGMIIAILGSIFVLIASIINQAIDFKEENELTV